MPQSGSKRHQQLSPPSDVAPSLAAPEGEQYWQQLVMISWAIGMICWLGKHRGPLFAATRQRHCTNVDGVRVLHNERENESNNRHGRTTSGMSGLFLPVQENSDQHSQHLVDTHARIPPGERWPDSPPTLLDITGCHFGLCSLWAPSEWQPVMAHIRGWRETSMAEMLGIGAWHAIGMEWFP